MMQRQSEFNKIYFYLYMYIYVAVIPFRFCFKNVKRQQRWVISTIAPLRLLSSANIFMTNISSFCNFCDIQENIDFLQDMLE